jgi:hypothetical protein
MDQDRWKTAGYRLTWIVTVLWIVIGCSHSTELKHPVYPSLIHSIQTVLLLPPETVVLEQSANGLTVRHEQAGRAAVAQWSQAIERILTGKGLRVATADPIVLNDPDIKELQSLYRLVERSIQLHTQGSQLFPAKLHTFDYEVGSVSGLLKQHAADALVIAIGNQTISQDRYRTWISIAVIEPQGRVIWYNKVSGQTDAAAQNPAEALQDLVELLINPFLKEVL